MKLTSTARLRIVTLLTSIFLTMGIGSFLAESSYKDALSNIDSAINETVKDSANSTNQELSAALFHIDQYSLDFALLLISRDGSVTTVNSTTTGMHANLTVSQARNAMHNVQSGTGPSHFRYRALKISGGDYLVVAASSEEVSKNLKSNLASVLLITLVTSILTFYFLSLFIRRLKREDDADALARMQSFLGDASHELRTPLTVIKGYVELLSTGQIKDPADQERALGRVTHEISRMEFLIHDLLLLAEIGESAQRSNEILQLSEITRAHVQDFALLNPNRKVQVEIADEVRIEGVNDYLSRFLQNTLNNISRHTGDDVPVRVSLMRRGRTAILTIEDGGPGLPESAYLEKVKSLNRFDPSRSRESGGSGLGMSIMSAVVTKLNGEMRLRKSELGGLAVIAELPTYRE